MGLYEHIMLPEQIKVASEFSPRVGGSGDNRRIPSRDKEMHSQRLISLFSEAQNENQTLSESMIAQNLPCRKGMYVEFAGKPAYELMVGSLESERSGIRLLNTRMVVTENDEEQIIATVHIPEGKENSFLSKLEEFATEITEHGKPKHDPLVRSIEQIRLAQLDNLWTGNENCKPNELSDWYEVWIQTKSADNTILYEDFKTILTALDIEFKRDSIVEFPERSIFVIKANQGDLILLLKSCDYLAEIRNISPLVSFFTDQRSYEQQEWISTLTPRIKKDNSSNSVISILDTGVNNTHPLLSDLMPDSNCDHVVDSDDVDRNGHGTEMCGVVTYGNRLYSYFEGSDTVIVNKDLISVKIMGREATLKENWGELTKQAVLKSKIAMPNKNISFCMAVTAKEHNENGKPSSWSGAIDLLTKEEASVFVISAGNINTDETSIIKEYPEGNGLMRILDPAQSWNALTVGAFTNILAPNCTDIQQFERVAPSGGLCPLSRTSILWNKSSIIKPEVVFEGGNLYKTNNSVIPYSCHDDLSVLTLNNNFNIGGGYFSSINATSCATAISADFAGRLQAKYPELWAESIRGLIVHSAKWTQEMLRQFPARNKREIARRLRFCGYGVPSEKRAFHSTENGFTFIAQEEIQPYIKKPGKSNVSINEMHLYELPWPQDILRELGEISVTLKITLSYFIEPSPGERGWNNKYRYASHGLRFDLNNTNETKREFQLRINDKIKAEENEERIPNDSSRWLIGSDTRDKGSIHSDQITLTAVELAECNIIGIYPIGGWWKTRPNMRKYQNKARYSLIISLDTPEENIDIYNDVKTKIETMIAQPITVEIPIE